MRSITNIVIHCSAGHTSAEKIQDYFTRPKSKGGRGWKKGGYHRIVEKNGDIKKMYDFSEVTNGVRHYNLSTIHICYVGGVNPEFVNRAVDTRTYDQKKGIALCIIEAIQWLKDQGKDVTVKLGIVGHRDFSPDGNRTGKIESWERIKECPSFDVLEEFSYLFASPDRYMKLPYQS